jgi:hypothetical protein
VQVEFLAPRTLGLIGPVLAEDADRLLGLPQASRERRSLAARRSEDEPRLRHEVMARTQVPFEWGHPAPDATPRPGDDVCVSLMPIVCDG